MAVSGDFPVSNDSSGTDTEIRYAENTDASGNSSDVTVSLYARTAVGTNGNGSWVLRVGGNTYTRAGHFSGSSSWERVATVTRANIPHTASGALSFPLGVESGGIPGTSWSNTAGTRDITFTNYDREPGTITGLSSSSGYRTISGSWNRPYTPSGLPILEYRYRYSTNTGYTNGATVSTGLNGSFTRSVNSDDDVYYWSVQARNADGWGPWSGNASVRTGPALPGTPGTLTIYNQTTTGFQLDWADVPGADAYQIEIGEASNYSDAGTNTTAESGYTTINKSAGTTYYVRVRARNESGYGPWRTGSTATAPNVPRTLTITDTQASDLTFTWEIPSPNGTRSITGYDVQVSTDPGFSPTETAAGSVGATTRRYTMSGLTPGIEYHVRVRAKNSAVPGAWTTAQSTTTVLAGGYIKTGPDTWVRMNAWIKTGADTWTRTVRVWNKTGETWQ